MHEPIGLGEAVHIVTRRLFEDDVRRHFAGTVTVVSGSLIRAEGWVFVFHRGTNEFIKRSDRRTRVFSLADSGNIVNVLPAGVDPSNLRYEFSDAGLFLTDGLDFAVDINEFGLTS
ncbi:MAG: hypothetical protein P8125_11915 [Gemmatimonadota bacterium]